MNHETYLLYNFGSAKQFGSEIWPVYVILYKKKIFSKSYMKNVL